MDATGAQLVGYAFDPWGRRTVVAGTEMTDRGFTGHRQGPMAASWTALYRAYDAELGRWFSRDPLGPVDGPNDYSYVRNNPINLRDELGLTAGGIGGGVGGAVAAGLFGGQANGDCSIVADGSGNFGLLCCASAGPSYGLTISGGPQGKFTLCRGCTSICELAGPSVNIGGTLGPVGGEATVGSEVASASA